MKIGDIVHLKSGGLNMTISNFGYIGSVGNIGFLTGKHFLIFDKYEYREPTENDGVVASWFANGTLHTAKFHKDMLKEGPR